MGPKYSTLKYIFLIWLTSVWFMIELLLSVMVCLPARASEQGNVIGSVSVYIYTVDPRLTGPQLSESSDYPEGKYLAHAQTIPSGRLVWRSPTLTSGLVKGRDTPD